MIERSALLDRCTGLIHGFSTRLGGVSKGPYATLNLGRAVGDEESCVDQNLVRFGFELGASTPVSQVSQVHGTTIVDVTANSSVDELRKTEADALFTELPGTPIGSRTADCAPILIAAEQRGQIRAVGAVHAGWRGATAGIVTRALERFVERGYEPGAIRVAIGPLIELEHFEVGPEVIDAARASLNGDEPPMRVAASGRPHLDLRALVQAHLVRSGVSPERIDHVGGCTFAQPALFYSHRRDHGRTGRHLSAIGMLE